MKKTEIIKKLKNKNEKVQWIKQNYKNIIFVNENNKEYQGCYDLLSLASAYNIDTILNNIVKHNRNKKIIIHYDTYKRQKNYFSTYLW